MRYYEPRQLRAPELFGEYWINGDPISIEDLEGQNVLIFFWDYSSAKCLDLLPLINTWFERYSEYGLAIIGVHSPEYKFGREYDNVANAVKRLEIRYPIVLDSHLRLWSIYDNRVWPTIALIDKDGYLRSLQEDEIAVEMLERTIQSLLIESGYRGVLPPFEFASGRQSHFHGAVRQHIGEIELGYVRGAIGNVGGFGLEASAHYDDLGMHLQGRFYLDGTWYSDREMIRYEGSQDEKGSVCLRYQAQVVSVILENRSDGSLVVVLYQDGEYVNKGSFGRDVLYGEDGKSYILVDKPRLYHLIRNPDVEDHELKIETSSLNLVAYSFSFGMVPFDHVVSRN
ncbi:MAG: redoxin domain-containing protein [bacterium]